MTKVDCAVQIWILAAQFEVRQLRMVEARKILGMSLGMCPKDRTYKAYIEVSCLTSAVVFISHCIPYVISFDQHAAFCLCDSH